MRIFAKTPWYRSKPFLSGLKYGLGVGAGLVAIDLVVDGVSTLAGRVSERIAARRERLAAQPAPEQRAQA